MMREGEGYDKVLVDEDAMRREDDRGTASGKWLT